MRDGRPPLPSSLIFKGFDKSLTRSEVAYDLESEERHSQHPFVNTHILLEVLHLTMKKLYNMSPASNFETIRIRDII